MPDEDVMRTRLRSLGLTPTVECALLEIATELRRQYEEELTWAQARVVELETVQRVAELRLGATGLFPYRKAGPDDEGELRMAITPDHNAKIVRLVFGTPVCWLGLPADEAEGLAKRLTEAAADLRLAEG